METIDERTSADELFAILTRETARRMLRTDDPEEFEKYSKAMDRIAGHMLKQMEINNKSLELVNAQEQQEYENEEKRKETKFTRVMSILESVGKVLSFKTLVKLLIAGYDLERDGMIRSKVINWISSMILRRR